MAADCGLALQTAHNHKHLLRKLGFIRIEKRPNGKRANPRHRITLAKEKLEPRHSTPRLVGLREERRELRQKVSSKSEGGRRASLSALSLWKELPRLDLIHQYSKSGWQVYPAYAPVFQEDVCFCSCPDGPNCQTPGKHPKFAQISWSRQFEGRPTKLLDYFFQNPFDNVGMWLPEGLMALDFDDPQAEAEIFPDSSPDTLTCSTPRGSHLYFNSHRDFRTSSSLLKAKLDVRSPGSWIMLPPSVHETGRKYKWDGLAVPLDIPTSLVELSQSAKRRGKDAQKPPDHDSITPFILPETIYHPDHAPKGDDLCGIGRNNHLFRYGRSMRSRGKRQVEIRDALQEANRERCIPPINFEEMEQLVKNVWNLPNAQLWKHNQL
jgi:hypothetical protein